MNAISTFTFLTQGSDEQRRLSVEALEQLLAAASLSFEDASIARDIVASIKETGNLPFEWTPQEDAFIRTSDGSKWLSYLIYRYKFKVYPLIKRVADFPVYTLIEPTSACNLRCGMCFQVDKTFTRKPYMGSMGFDLYTRVIDELAEGGTKAITFASRGEPLLNRSIGEMLMYASGGKFIDIKLNTNATMLTSDVSRSILSSDVNELVFSIDAHEKELYESIRINAKFEQVLDNVTQFHRIRDKEFPGSRLQTRVSGVKFKPEQDPKGYVDFWSKIVDHVGYVDIEDRWDTYNNEPHPSLTSSCDYLWGRTYIWWDGRMGVCDVDYKSMLSPGTIGKQSIRDIWHGELYTKLRADHLAGLRGKHTPCDRCGV